MTCRASTARSRRTCRSRSSSARTTRASSALDRFVERADRAGVLLDFDGSLSPIVDRPELAAAASGVHDALEALVPRFRVVAIISGRPGNELVDRVHVDGLTYVGLYGLEGVAPELTVAALPLVERAVDGIPGAWVEDKRLSITVHYRQAPDPSAARRALRTVLDPIAVEAGLDLIEGKRAIELVPADRPMKGGAVERLLGEHGLQAALFAGDDLADLDAFAALDRAASRGLVTVKVAVRGDETPAELVEAADETVEGPEGLVELLRRLA